MANQSCQPPLVGMLADQNVEITCPSRAVVNSCGIPLSIVIDTMALPAARPSENPVGIGNQSCHPPFVGIFDDQNVDITCPSGAVVNNCGIPLMYVAVTLALGAVVPS